MFYPDSSRCKSAKIANIVCEKTFRHIVRKLTKNATYEPSKISDSSVCTFSGIVYEFNDWSSATLSTKDNLSVVKSNYSGNIYLPGDVEYYSFIRHDSLRMCYGQIKGMFENQQFHYQNKTSYKKHRIAQSINRMQKRNTTARELATMGLLI